MSAVLISASSTEPVALADAKLHLRIDGDEEDSLLTALISTARVHCEDFTGLSLVEKTWDLWLSEWPAEVMLREPPVKSVTYVKYYDRCGNELTLDASRYLVDDKSSPGRIVPVGDGWPGDALQAANGIVVRYITGPAPEDASKAIRQAMLLLLGQWYAFREGVNVGNIVNELPFAVKALLSPYRVWL